MNNFLTAQVVKVVNESRLVRTIHFTVDGAVLPFISGQYVSLYFADLPFKAGKAYSLSSVPADATMSVTVKNIGVYSGRICALKAGDEFFVSSPYGFFNADEPVDAAALASASVTTLVDAAVQPATMSNLRPIVAIAAGVGISPIWSIIRDRLASDPAAPVVLYFTVPTKSDLLFLDAINRLQPKSANFVTNFYITRDKVPDDSPNFYGRRFSVIDDPSVLTLPNCRYYICGAADFVRSIWQQLMQAGVNEQDVASEVFFEASL